MKPGSDRVASVPNEPFERWFILGFGLFLGLSLLKFGNPPIMEKWVAAPTNVYEFVLGSPWPILWAYVAVACLSIAGLFLVRWKISVPAWLLALPLAWFLWECLAGAFSESRALTAWVLPHFAACVLCFYIGFFCVGPSRYSGWLHLGLLCGFLFVIAVGWQQHFGGLDATRQYFFLYIYPRLKEVPPEYLKKISSTRIFSTLFYPNALAGALLLLLPPVLQLLWQARDRFTQGARVFLVSSVGVAALACLYWSGSKGGWLLMLVLALIWLMRLPMRQNLKRLVLMTFLVFGLAGFFWKYSGFFQKGATSVGARIDYWSAALRTTMSHPLFGTGPGTFSIAYQRVKKPESEMARLAHNDYLEQASDSGVPGFGFFTGFIATALFAAFPFHRRDKEDSPRPNQVGMKRPLPGGPPFPISRSGLQFAIWLGVLGWALQSLMEFSLYIPALAWPALTFLGLLLRQRSID